VIRARKLVGSAPDGEDWYANLLWSSGRKCLLVTQCRDAVFGVRGRCACSGPARSRSPGHGLIGRELLRQRLPGHTFGGLEPAEVVPAKTADRSVLGCMNDVAFMCEVAITHSGGLARTDIAELNQALRRNINSVRDYQPPIELTAQRPRASR